jgi:hypothetical protein
MYKVRRLRLLPHGGGHLQLSGQEQPCAEAELVVYPSAALLRH